MKAGMYVGPLGSLKGQGAWPDVNVGCVWLPLLPLRAEILRHPSWAGKPLVMGGGPGQRKVVQLCTPEAERAGIHPGLPLREVLSFCREAIVLQGDPVRTALVLEEVLQCLQSVTPAVELGQADAWSFEAAFFLSLQGMAQVYGRSLDALERSVRSVVPGLLDPRIGLAGSKFTAKIAAQLAPSRQRLIVPAERTTEFLSPLPVNYLPFMPHVLDRLELLGIQTIGELAALSFSAVQAQFGRVGARAWCLAHGQADEPVLSRPYSPTIRAALRCDDPLSSLEAFLAALDQLLTRAFANPAMRGASARQVRLRALLSDSSSWEKTFTFKEPLAGRPTIRHALWSKLKAASMLPAAPIEELALEFLGLGPEVARQLPLFGSRLRQQRRLTEAVRQMTALYGQTPIYQPVEVEPWSRMPERRWALTPFDP